MTNTVKTGSYLDAVLWEQSFDAFWNENSPSAPDFHWAAVHRNSLFIGPNKDAYCYTSPGVGYLV